MQRGLPRCRVCLHDDTDISLWTDWIHGLLQGCEERREEAGTVVAGRRGREAMPLLQSDDPRGCVHPANFCAKSIAIALSIPLVCSTMAQKIR